jgi:5'-nucleotidase
VTRPLILITNDDGVLSPGLLAVAEAVDALGDIVIAAPRYQQTSMGRAFPKADTNGLIETLSISLNGREHPAYGVHGSPALAVSHGILEISPRQPDLVISGVNYGENIGFSITTSGTIGAAFQAAGFGVPALAVSLETALDMHHAAEYGALNWATARHFTQHFAALALREGLPPEIAVWNINIPGEATPDTSMKWTRMSRQNYYTINKPPTRDWAQPYAVQSRPRFDPATLEAGSDVHCFAVERCVSITPILWDWSGLR